MSARRPSSKKQQQTRATKQKQWEQEATTINEFRAKAPYIKAILRRRGCILPFYDYLESYADEFHRIADAARAEHPSLLGVHEVDDAVFSGSEKHWPKLGYGDLQQIFFGIEEDVSDYETVSPDANLCGSMSAFLDPNGNLRTVILIQQSVRASAVRHREFKYAMKIASLLHEIGHVQDLERGLNFDAPGRHLRIVEAEVFAHLFALEEMARRNLAESLNVLVRGLQNAIPQGGYLSEVAKKVFGRSPTYQLVKWQKVISARLTPDEEAMLGPKGMEALRS